MNSPNDNDIIYLSVNDLYNINAEVTGMVPFVRDLHLLESAARRPTLRLFGQPQFPTLADKAAALLHSLAYHHLFADGNKRTAWRALELFLDANGYTLADDADTCAPYILEVAKGNQDVRQVAGWLRERIVPQT